MSGHIFLINNDRLIQMTEQPYDSEDLLQRLLAQYPDLLAGDQINDIEPRRWLLISREVAVPDEEEGSGRWALDHLLLDQDAIPTLVEVKRSKDTRIRREVVGQMLDYASNAVVYWQVDKLRAQFEAECQQAGNDPIELIGSQLGISIDPDQFWENVRTNLLAGKIRLVFVADEIPYELQRIVEFLNKQMNPAEVLAVEIRQYVGQGLRTLVPKVIGQTAEAQQSKSGLRSSGRQWDRETFLEDLENHKGKQEVEVVRKILAWAEARQLRIWWGKGSKDGSFTPMLNYRGISFNCISVWTYGRIEVLFQYMRMKPPFDQEPKRLELLHYLNQILADTLPQDSINRRPTFAISRLTDETKLHQFLSVLDWFIEEVKAGQ